MRTLNIPSSFASKAALACILIATARVALAANNCIEPKPTTGQVAYRSVTAKAADGVCLRSFTWQPSQGGVRGVVVITHGIRDYALRYAHFAEQLTRQGFAVYAQDLRGHAHSGGERQRFDSMAQMVADTDLIVSRARQQNPGVPLFLYGHSLGGLITTEYTLAHGDALKGVVLSGAALMRPHSVSGFSVTLARMVAMVAPGLKAVEVDDSEFSRDKAVMAALARDPLISHDKLPAASAVASLDGIENVRKKMRQLKTPLLVMYGTADKVNPIEGSKALIKGAGSADKSLKTYEGVYHDMMNEPEHATIAGDVIAWLNARL